MEGQFHSYYLCSYRYILLRVISVLSSKVRSIMQNDAGSTFLLPYTVPRLSHVEKQCICNMEIGNSTSPPIASADGKPLRVVAFGGTGVQVRPVVEHELSNH